MKPAWVLAALALVPLAPALVSCRPPLVPAKPKVSLRMSGTPLDATVVIDDEVVGALELVAARGVALPVGTHHITVKAGGYFPWDKEVTAEEGERPIVLRVTLVPIPD